MSASLLRVLSYSNYLNYVRCTSDRHKEYGGNPYKFEIHNPRLFDAWVERAECNKKAADANRRNKQEFNRDSISSPEDLPQSILTAKFYEYYENVVLEYLNIAYYELMTGRPMTAMMRKKKIFNPANDRFMIDEKTMFEREMEKLSSFVGMVVWLNNCLIS